MTGAANENGKVAEDSETLPDQTPAQTGDAKPADEPAAAATSADSTAAAIHAETTAPADAPSAETAATEGTSPAETAALADAPPAETAAPAEAPAAADSSTETGESSSEPVAAAPEQGIYRVSTTG